MIQVNNGFKEQYYLQKNGNIYNARTKRHIKPDKSYCFYLKTVENTTKKITLKSLYKMVYHKTFCIDHIKNMDQEIWKEISNTDTQYWISDKGRIKSYHGYNAKLLNPYHNQAGYARIDLRQNGLRQSKLVHRLVAAAFLPFPQSIDMQLHHKDFNKANNAASNLEWLAAAEHKKIHQEQRRSDSVCTESEKDLDRKIK